jgi:hypothetical protein
MKHDGFRIIARKDGARVRALLNLGNGGGVPVGGGGTYIAQAFERLSQHSASLPSSHIGGQFASTA